MRRVCLALCLAACTATGPASPDEDGDDPGGKGDGTPGALPLDIGAVPPPGDPIEIRALAMRGHYLRLDVAETGPGCGHDDVHLYWDGALRGDPPRATLRLRRWEQGATCDAPERRRRLYFELGPIGRRVEAGQPVALELDGDDRPDAELRGWAVIGTFLSEDPGEPILVGAPPAGDPVQVSYVYVDGDLLHVGAEWLGGCETHEAAVYWDGALGAERRVDLTLVHVAHGDLCARPQAVDVEVDLRSLAPLRAAAGEPALVLRVAGTPWEVPY